MRALRGLGAGACLACGLSSLLGGCAPEQAYEAGRSMRQNACNRLPDNAERERCVTQAGGAYDDYERRGEAR